MTHDEPPILTDITASSRRAARKAAAEILFAAGWDLGRISLAFGIGQGAAQYLMPQSWRDSIHERLWGKKP
jgi:hypothetical protein